MAQFFAWNYAGAYLRSDAALLNSSARRVVSLSEVNPMYCPSCGERTTQGLSYCKHCGAELNARDIDPTLTSARSSAFFAAAMVGTFVFGLAAIAGLIAVMKACNLNEGLINAFALMSFLLMVILEAIFTRLLLRSTFGKRASERALTPRATNELDAPPSLMLSAPAMSVTEHTTRTLEPVRDQEAGGRKQ